MHAHQVFITNFLIGPKYSVLLSHLHLIFACTHAHTHTHTHTHTHLGLSTKKLENLENMRKLQVGMHGLSVSVIHM
jgi:hypothetical protein